MKDITWRDTWEQYLALWRKLTGWKLFLFYTLHYTLLFFALKHLVFAAFAEEEKSFIMSIDGDSQHFARLVYINQLWRENIRSLLSVRVGPSPSMIFLRVRRSWTHRWVCPNCLRLFGPAAKWTHFIPFMYCPSIMESV